ncbi:MAG: DUF4136 domain-containing protein [Bacteroidales bacterium]|jgi:hypothetical protein
MKRKIFFLLGIVFFMVSCYPDGPETYEELDIVYTDYDDSFDFQGKGTYSMPDQIVKVTGNLQDGEAPEFVKEPYNTQMLNRIASNMATLGWTRVDEPENADLVLFPAVWTNTTIYYWNDYWCWYYYYYCGWGWNYPVVTSYTTGTLAMALVAYGDEYIQPTIMWTAAINGLVSGSYDANRVTKSIDQAFTQSPYLNTK